MLFQETTKIKFNHKNIPQLMQYSKKSTQILLFVLLFAQGKSETKTPTPVATPAAATSALEYDK